MHKNQNVHKPSQIKDGYYRNSAACRSTEVKITLNVSHLRFADHNW